MNIVTICTTAIFIQISLLIMATILRYLNLRASDVFTSLAKNLFLIGKKPNKDLDFENILGAAVFAVQNNSKKGEFKFNLKIKKVISSQVENIFHDFNQDNATKNTIAKELQTKRLSRFIPSIQFMLYTHQRIPLLHFVSSTIAFSFMINKTFLNFSTSSDLYFYSLNTLQVFIPITFATWFLVKKTLLDEKQIEITSKSLSNIANNAATLMTIKSNEQKNKNSTNIKESNESNPPALPL